MKVLLVTTLGWGGGLRSVQCIRAAGAEVHVATSDQRLPFLLSRHCASVLSLPDPDRAGWEREAGERIMAHVRARGIDILMPSRVEDAKLVDAIRPRLDGVALFPYAAPATLDRLNNKWSFAGLCRDAGIPIPATGLLESVREKDLAAPGGLEYPVIVKPLAMYGNRGVRRFDDAASLGAYLAGPGRHNELPLLVQAFVAGRDVGHNILAEEGRVLLSVTQRRTPSSHAVYYRDEEADGIGRRMAAAVGYTGLANLDLRQEAGSGVLLALECNPRCWDSLYLAYWAGWNFIEAGIQCAQGRPITAGGGDLPATVFAPVGLGRDAVRDDWSWLRMSRRNRAGVAWTLAHLPSFAAIRLSNIAKRR